MQPPTLHGPGGIDLEHPAAPRSRSDDALPSAADSSADETVPSPSAGSAPEDAVLLAAVRAGDHRAVAQLHARYAPALEAFVRRRALDPTQAQEIVQEVFLAAWRDAGRFDPARGSVAAWLFALARNKTIDRLRRESVERRHRAEVDPASSVAPHDVHHAAWMRIRRDRVREAVRALPEPQRAALELAFYGGLTHVEVADRLGIPLGTAKTRIRAGLQRMRAGLVDLLADPLQEGSHRQARPSALA